MHFGFFFLSSEEALFDMRLLHEAFKVKAPYHFDVKFPTSLSLKERQPDMHCISEPGAFETRIQACKIPANLPEGKIDDP